MTIKLSLVVGESGGSALGTDAAPNVTEPPEGRVVGTPVKNGHALGGPVTAIAYVLGGTNLTIETYVRVAQLGDLAVGAQPKGRWFLHIGPAVVAADTSNELGTIPPNCDVFFRISAATGGEQLGIQLL